MNKRLGWTLVRQDQHDLPIGYQQSVRPGGPVERPISIKHFVVVGADNYDSQSLGIELPISRYPTHLVLIRGHEIRQRKGILGKPALVGSYTDLERRLDCLADSPLHRLAIAGLERFASLAAWHIATLLLRLELRDGDLAVNQFGDRAYRYLGITPIQPRRIFNGGQRKAQQGFRRNARFGLDLFRRGNRGQRPAERLRGPPRLKIIRNRLQALVPGPETEPRRPLPRFQRDLGPMPSLHIAPDSRVTASPRPQSKRELRT